MSNELRQLENKKCFGLQTSFLFELPIKIPSSLSPQSQADTQRGAQGRPGEQGAKLGDKKTDSHWINVNESGLEALPSTSAA